MIKKLYPVENYRSSGDIDILIKDSDFEKSCKVLESLGYKTFEKPNKGNDYHISYEKNSVHIELHSSLALRTLIFMIILTSHFIGHI